MKSLALILIPTQILIYINYAQPFSAGIKNFKEFEISCTNKVKLKTIKKKYHQDVCEAYISGYLDVANHNCDFDLYPDNLHKLNTRKISIKQITKAWEIYHQRLPNGIEGNIIDHLWRALNPHWPCESQ